MESFDLGEILTFTLYRGDELSAPAEDLAYEITFVSIDDMTIHLIADFEKPEMVSLHQNVDVVVVGINDSSFSHNSTLQMLLMKSSMLSNWWCRKC